MCLGTSLKQPGLLVDTCRDLWSESPLVLPHRPRYFLGPFQCQRSVKLTTPAKPPLYVPYRKAPPHIGDNVYNTTPATGDHVCPQLASCTVPVRFVSTLRHPLGRIFMAGRTGLSIVDENVDWTPVVMNFLTQSSTPASSQYQGRNMHLRLNW